MKKIHTPSGAFPVVASSSEQPGMGPSNITELVQLFDETTMPSDGTPPNDGSSPPPTATIGFGGPDDDDRVEWCFVFEAMSDAADRGDGDAILVELTKLGSGRLKPLSDDLVRTFKGQARPVCGPLLIDASLAVRISMAEVVRLSAVGKQLVQELDEDRREALCESFEEQTSRTIIRVGAYWFEEPKKAHRKNESARFPSGKDKHGNEKWDCLDDLLNYTRAMYFNEAREMRRDQTRDGLILKLINTGMTEHERRCLRRILDLGEGAE